MNTRAKHIFVSALAVVIGGVLVGAAVKRRTNIITARQEPQVTATELPPISSSINELEVVNAYVDDHGELIITLFNNSKKAIKAIAVSSGSYRVILDEGLVSDNPKTIIESKANYVVDLPIADLKSTMPLIVSGVIYDDDTEGGKADVVSKIRQARQREKEKRLSKSNDREEP